MNGLCRAPGICQCFEGWIDEDCSRGLIFGIVYVYLPNTMQEYASHLVELMECVMLTLDTVTVLLDSPVPPVMMVYETDHIL